MFPCFGRGHRVWEAKIVGEQAKRLPISFFHLCYITEITQEDIMKKKSYVFGRFLVHKVNIGKKPLEDWNDNTGVCTTRPETESNLPNTIRMRPHSTSKPSESHSRIVIVTDYDSGDWYIGGGMDGISGGDEYGVPNLNLDSDWHGSGSDSYTTPADGVTDF